MNTSRVERIELAPGFTISRILTGLWQIADMERQGWVLDPETTSAAMASYVEAGLTTFDMADHYGSAEDMAGHFMEGRRSRSGVEIATKWVPQPGPISRDDVRAAVERALGRLRSQAIDLLQFHAWCYWDPRYLDALHYLRELQQEGLIRFLGVTNFDTAHLRLVLASGIQVVSNQISYSLFDRRAQGPMREVCSEHGIKLLAYGTLAGGLLTDRYLGVEEPPEMGTWSEMKYKRFLDTVGNWQNYQGLLRILSRVARRHGVSIANVAGRYILEDPTVAGVIIGARLGESDHIRENLRLFEFALDEEDRAQIEAALADWETIPGDCGDEYRRPPFLTAAGDLSHHFDAAPPAFAIEDKGDGRQRVVSGTRWEEAYGYCRALREGRHIWVAGTTATHGERLVGGHSAALQATFIFDKIEGALRSLGSRLEDVVRTRVYVSDIADWQEVAEVHGRRFGHVQPVNTLVEARLVGDEYLVEIEVEAVIGRTKR